MSSEAYRRAFEAGLSRDAIAGVRFSSEFAKEETWRAAGESWRGRDRTGFVAAARALRAIEPLKPRMALRLAVALLELGAAREALDVLTDPRAPPSPPDIHRELVLAQALLGAARFRDAREALQRAMDLGAGSGAHARAAGRLDELIDLASRAGPAPSWADVVALTSGLGDLGLHERAAEALQGWLEHGEFPPEALDPLLEAATDVFRMIEPCHALPLLAALRGLYDAEGEGSLFAATWAALLGDPDDAPIPELAEDDDRGRALLGCLAQACAAAERWRVAIRRFARLAERPELMPDSLLELARCVGRDLLSGMDFQLAPPGPRKVFNLIPFNGELMMLELKLGEMADWVDHFVIVEAAQTFTGRPKPMYFRDNRERFEAWADKIIYVPVETLPPYLETSWAREFYQKASAVRGVSGLCGPDDIVLISDVDEIVDRRVFEGLSGEPVSMGFRTFVYFLNCELVLAKPSLKAVLLKGRYLPGNGSCYLRLGLARYSKHRHIAYAGWHFRSVNTPEALEWKMKSYSHENWQHLDRERFERMLAKVRRRRKADRYVVREIDDEFPEYLRRNRQALAQFIL